MKHRYRTFVPGALLVVSTRAAAQAAGTDSIRCTQRIAVGTGARELVCENRRPAERASLVPEAQGTPRGRSEAVEPQPPTGAISTTDLATARAAAEVSRSMPRAGR